MEYVVRTAYGALLQTCQLLGLPVPIMANTTLNQKLSIHQDVSVADTDHVAVKYIGIGNRGHRMASGVDNISFPESLQHETTDAGAFNQLPFVLRLPSEDLNAIERQKYRLRRTEVHGGTTYVAYYLKLMDLSSTVPQLELRTVSNGIVTSTDFNASLANLNPEPPALLPGQVLTTSGDYVAATAKVPFALSDTDVVEFLNVCNIIYGDEKYAIISEIILCSGVDRALTGDFNGVSTGYTDAVGVQIYAFISEFFSVKYSSRDLTATFDLGSLEPLLKIQ